MKTNLISLGREINEKSDRFIVWNTKHYSDYDCIEKKSCPCDFYQLEEKKYDPQTKRLWIYVNHPENKLMYIFQTNLVRGKLPVNPDCGEDCREHIEEYNQGKSKSYVSDKICKFAYELKLMHKFDKGNSLEELRKYRHRKSGKPWKPPQSFAYVSSYPELVEDVKARKVW